MLPHLLLVHKSRWDLLQYIRWIWAIYFCAWTAQMRQYYSRFLVVYFVVRDIFGIPMFIESARLGCSFGDAGVFWKKNWWRRTLAIDSGCPSRQSSSADGPAVRSSPQTYGTWSGSPRKTKGDPSLRPHAPSPRWCSSVFAAACFPMCHVCGGRQ